MLRVKICGITRAEDALMAAELGADGIGFVFFDKSPRYVSPEAAAEISLSLPPHVAQVGVFVDPAPSQVSAIMSTVCLHAVQLHGLHRGECIKGFSRTPVILALAVGDSSVNPQISTYGNSVAATLLDTFHTELYGGTGVTFNWHYAAMAAKSARIILAGGLRPENVCRAVETVKPYGVDVSSGVEHRPGIKDTAKLKAFFSNLRKYRRDWKPERKPLFQLA